MVRPNLHLQIGRGIIKLSSSKIKRRKIMKKTTIIIVAIVVILAIILGGILLMRPKTEKVKDLKLKTSEEVEQMLNTIYTSEKIELPALETTVIDVSDEMQVSSFTGLKSNENIEFLVVSAPLINAQAYSLAVVKVSENADIEKMKQEMLDNIDMRKWICVSAEKLYITNYENIIFLVMSSEEWAKPVYTEFKNFVGNEIGKELEKSETLDPELPPEML